jgi:RNA polymerase sigma-70 factor (ECF subfamily)
VSFLVLPGWQMAEFRPISEHLNAPRDFRTTHWSVVLQAGDGSDAALSAMEKLCRTYWYPLYSFVRRRGHGADEAQDLTQAFFERFLEKNYLADVSAGRGRFRSFLLASLQHFLANEWDRSRAQKRGGGANIISLDQHEGEERFHFEPPDPGLTPEKAFERRWVEAVLDQVLARLRDECNEAGHRDRFEALKVFLVEDKGAVSFAEMAERLEMTEPAVKGLVRRMRQRYREIFREEIANTVADPKEVDEEIRYLIGVLSDND